MLITVCIVYVLSVVWNCMADDLFNMPNLTP
jgi:hypothetical protein